MHGNRLMKIVIIFPFICLSSTLVFAKEQKSEIASNPNIASDFPIQPVDDLGDDLAMFYKDLNGIPVYPGSGGVAAIGEQSFTVQASDSLPVVAASRFGDGRVVVAGNPQYFDLSIPHDSDQGIFTRNILQWLTDEGNSGDEDTHTNHYDNALNNDSKKISLITILDDYTVDSSLPIDLIKVDRLTSINLNPEEHTVVLVDASLDDGDLSILEDYIQDGGSVIVTERGQMLEGISRNTALEYRLHIGNYRGDRLSQHFAVQKLLNSTGLSLVNMGVTANNTLAKLTEEQAINNHTISRLHQAREFEQGNLTIDEIEIGYDSDDENRKQDLLTATIVKTLETLSSQSGLYSWIEEEVYHLPLLTFPYKKEDDPYSNALYHFQFSHFTLSVDNEKSLYADDFPGKVSANATVINNKEIIVNLDYIDTSTNYTRALPSKHWISTGLYAAPGEVIEIDVPKEAENLSVQIGSHDDDLKGLNEWKRVPEVVHHKKLVPGTNRVSSPYGGMIYFIPMKPKEDTEVTIKLSGAVQAPNYELGETTQEEWDDLRLDPATPFAELKSNSIVLVVPSEVIQELDNPEELMSAWNEMVMEYDKFAGLSPEKEMPNTSPQTQRYYVVDRQIRGGSMHAGYPIMLTVGQAENLVDVDYLRTSAWGFWHELGHEYEQSPMLFSGTSEVITNVYSLYIEEYFGNPSRLLEQTNGQDYYEHAFDYLNSENPNKKFSDNGHFESLVLFSQLQLAFGWDLFTDLQIHYREMDDDQLPRTDQQKIDEFVVKSSEFSGKNLLEFFEKWVIGHSDEAIKRVEEMDLPRPDTDIWTLRNWNPGETPPSKIILDQDELHIDLTNLGEKINAKVLPEDATDRIKWSSSDSAVATVNKNGYIAGISEGTATITAESIRNPNIKAEIEVIVGDMSGYYIPMADAYVQNGNHENANFGDATTLSVKSDIPGYGRESYLKFDISEIDFDTSESIILNLFAEEVNDEPERTINIYATDHDWEENTITWNNAPEELDLIDSKIITPEGKGEWHKFDLTDYLKTSKSEGIVSFLIKNPGPTSQKNNVEFSSKEGDGNLPQLIVTTDEDPDPSGISADQIIDLVKKLTKSGEFSDDEIPHLLTRHLTAVGHYEDEEKAEKVIKHMKSFNQLLDHLSEDNLISEDAHFDLTNHANALIKKWQ